jgi:S1-C subfamily serine protease
MSRVFMWSWTVLFSIVVAMTMSAATRAADVDLPKQPQLGFEGHLVDVSEYLPGHDSAKAASMGMRVDKVKRGTPAWKMGLGAGDIVVSIDTWRFTTNKGYRQALRAAGQRPSIIVIDSSTKKMVRHPCSLPHVEPTETDLTPQTPDSYQMGITLESDIEPNSP